MKKTPRKKQQISNRKKRNRKTKKRIGGSEINIDVNDTIDVLNGKIQVKCENLFLSINRKEKLPGKKSTYNEGQKRDTIVLCLYNSLFDPPECISSIEYNIDSTNKNILNISSRTKDNEQGKKYNTLLRACSVILAKTWGFQQLLSNAENPISLWLLTKEYDYTTDTHFSEFIRNKKLTQSLIGEYYAEDPDFVYVDVIVEITDKNVEKAFEIIQKTPFVCSKTETPVNSPQ